MLRRVGVDGRISADQDAVTGFGWVDDPNTDGFDGYNLNIDAKSDPFGGNPTGRIDVDTQSPTRYEDPVSGAVTCMRVMGNRAILGFYGRLFGSDDFYGPPSVGLYTGLVEVVDGGPAEKDVVRAMSDLHQVELVEDPNGGYVFPEPAPTWPKITACPSALPRVDETYTIPPTYPIPDFVHPEDFVQVHDARPTPISKDQCKNGGHVSFGFKNQGECVAFVQRGPKP